jgi:hypothetical protein
MTGNEHSDRIDRRQFLQGVGTAAAAALLGGGSLQVLSACSTLTSGREFFAYYTRRDGVEDVPGHISGPYADLVVHVGSQRGKLVFSREFSYRPEWQSANGNRLIGHLANINGDGPEGGRFDRWTQYAYARIVGSGPSEIRVEWRYFPDFDHLDPTSVVQELYVIGSDGRVTREFRPGTATIDAWNDPVNKTVQTFELTPAGIRNVKTTRPASSPPPGPVEGNPTLGPAVGTPVAWWRFDEAEGNTVRESQTDKRHPVDGHKSLWKRGVSGTALAFDGYSSKVSVPASDAPRLGNEVTLEAWVALGAYPWNVAPIVHRSLDLGKSGYYLGFDEYGHPVFTVNDQQLEAESVILPLITWTHVAGVYDGESMVIFVNGSERASRPASGEPGTPETPLLIGMNNKETLPTEGVRNEEPDELSHFSLKFGLEGIIDEVRVHDVALSDAEVAASFDRFNPGLEIVDAPDLQPRVAPGMPGVAEEFGATHARLAYHDLWDNMWRVTDDADVIVKFDDRPTSIVYWRGTTHGVNLVTDKNYWMSDQSVELVHGEKDTRSLVSLAEHMSDKEARRSHVRVIENTEARVVVHWRYAVADVLYNLAGPRAFVDEVHTIYPDGILIRHVFYYDTLPEEDGREHYHDFQLLINPGDRPENMVDPRALTIANVKGRQEDIVFPVRPADSESALEDGNITLIHLKSNWKVFGVAQGGSLFAWSSAEEPSNPYHVNYDGRRFPFGGPWNHWPDSRIPSDGRFVTAYDRLASFALGSQAPQEFGTGSMLYGFTEASSTEALLPTARSWLTPPSTDRLKGLKGLGYNTDRRAYEFVASNSTMSFELSGSNKKPIVNPCFVIKSWGGDQRAMLKIDSKNGSDVRQGIVHDVDGTRTMIVWVPFSSTLPHCFTISGKE